MVVSLGPGKFYGKSLPRPRFYTDVKFNDHRVDPPSSVVDPLMSWAEDAHWSMGGLSFKRLRLQGRIEGNVKKLRSQRQKTINHRLSSDSRAAVCGGASDSDDDLVLTEVVSSPSPPPAPIASKRKRLTAAAKKRKIPARKLDEEFDRVAAATAAETVGVRTRSGRVAAEMKPVEEMNTQKVKKRRLRRIGEIQKAKEVLAMATPTKSVSPSSIIPRSSPRLGKNSMQ